MFMFYTLSVREGEGLYCGRDRLTYGGMPLVAKTAQGGFAPCTLDGFFKSVLADRAGGLRAVANALNKGNFALAAIAAVHLRLPTLNADQVEKIAKWNFNAFQPRVPKGNPDGGQWTSDDSGSNDSAMSDIDQDDSDNDSGNAQYIPVQEEALPLTPDFAWPDWLANPKPWIDPVPGAISPYNIPPDLTDEEKAECQEEWEYAWEKCNQLEEQGILDQKFSNFGKNVLQCVRGMVSARCGGNPVA